MMPTPPPPDFICPMCRAKFALMPVMVLVCEACDTRSCCFECIKRHRAERHPAYTGKYPIETKGW